MPTMKLESILVGLDFSAPAIRSAEWVSEYFAPSATVTLLHVIDPPDRPRFAAALLPAPETVESIVREHAEQRLREIAASFTRPTPRCEIRVGKPHEQIAELAASTKADLVVIGPHGDRLRTSNFLGTSADRVIRTSRVPILVATAPPAGRPRRLLVPVDDAEITTTVLAWAHDLAQAFDADVTLLHVWSNAEYSHVASMAHATSGSEAKAREEIEKDLREAGVRWLDELASMGIDRSRVTATVTHGNAGEVVLETAERTHADLIVMGRRGSGLVAATLLGSTLRTVLAGARCPVLVVT